jgi:hypothetical protein
MSSGLIIDKKWCDSLRLGLRRRNKNQKPTVGQRLSQTQKMLATKAKYKAIDPVTIFWRIYPTNLEEIDYCCQDTEFYNLQSLIRHKSKEKEYSGLSTLQRKRDLLQKELVVKQPFGSIAKFINRELIESNH